MSKVKLLKQVVDDLKQLTGSLEELCDAMEMNHETVVDTKEEQSQPIIGLEDVRAVLAEKSRNGFTKDVKTVIQSFGVNKLSEVKSEDYPSLLEKAKEIENE